MPRQLDDWLENYLAFTKNSESPTLYHLWSGITAISSCLRRKCYTDWGLRGYVYPNLYVALVGPPGGRKGTAMKIAKSMLPTDLSIGSDALGSTQILYKEIRDAEDSYIEFDGKEKKHKSLSVWSEEFQVFLSDKDPMLIASLTDLFDCANTWKYSTLKRGAEDLSNCWLTIIGAITPSLLQSKLSQDAVGGGLVSRIIFIVGYGPIKKKALQFLSKEAMLMKEKLTQDLEHISLLSGPFMLTNSFIKKYVHWYEDMNAEAGVDSDKFMGYNSRRALHLNKLCMILSASENDSMEITETHFLKALAILEEAEKEMPNAFYGLGRGIHGDFYAEILDYVECQDMFSWQDFLQKFQFKGMPNELKQYIDMLKQVGKISVEKSATTTMYIVNHDSIKPVNNNFLKNTLYRKM